jgi:F-type H+-transporting ATPase subunit c
MNKLRYIFFAVLTLALLAVSAFAQDSADNASTVKASNEIGIGLGVLGFGLAAGLAGIGQGLVGSKGAEGAARNPGAAGTVQTLMIIALALIESLVLFALLIVFLKITRIP